LTQDILNLSDGESTEALLLNPQGQIEQQLKIIFSASEIFLIVDAEKAESLISWLSRMRFRKQVEIEQTDIKVYGTFEQGFGLYWRDNFSWDNKNSVSYSPSRRPFHYFESLSSSAPNLARAGLSAFHALRIFAGRPEITDIDDRSLPHEFDWLSSAVHLSKGCYRGQESVSKVHNLGHPPRRLALLHLSSGDELAKPGDKVFYLDKEVGKVRASAIHYEAGSIALVLLTRNTPYLDLLIEINGHKVSATQEVLVPADAGKAANLPRPSSFKLSKRS
jgi:hypothetical protein